jgi:hypothetical protein
MSTTEITSLPDGKSPAHVQVVRLGAFDYVLTHRYQARNGAWHLDVDDYPSVRRVSGIRMRTGINLFGTMPGRGTLHVLPAAGGYGSVGLTDFATGRFRLWWDEVWDGIP